MKSNAKSIIGLSVGIASGVAAAVAGGLAVAKIVKEIKCDLKDTTFVSPNETNQVIVTYGSSSFAKGMTFVKVVAENDTANCPMLMLILGKKTAKISCEWLDDDHFVLSRVGKSGSKQICEACFEDGMIVINHNVKKVDATEEVIEAVAEEVVEEAVEEIAEEASEEATQEEEA